MEKCLHPSTSAKYTSSVSHIALMYSSPLLSTIATSFPNLVSVWLFKNLSNLLKALFRVSKCIYMIYALRFPFTGTGLAKTCFSRAMPNLYH